jgi:hypothetical protein
MTVEWSGGAVDYLFSHACLLLLLLPLLLHWVVWVCSFFVTGI